MCEHFLSILHIQKLGHSIEEIRVRALLTIISKHNLNLVDENNLENSKLLLEKLLQWFNFEKYSEEEKVLNLLLRILEYENAGLILEEVGVAYVSQKITELEKKIGFSYSSIVQKIKDCIAKLINSHKTFNNLPSSQDSEDLFNKKTDTHRALNYMPGSSQEPNSQESNFSDSLSELNVAKLDLNDVNGQCEFEEKKCMFRVEYFPWQHLTIGDKHVISSVFDGLRYVDNKNSILQSCQFFNEVVIRDFPIEVFIQRPLLVRTLFQLVKNSEKEIRIHVTQLLIKILQHLKQKRHFVLKPSLFHTKQEFYSTNVFPTTLNDLNSDPSELGDYLHLQMRSFDEDLFDCDDDNVDHNAIAYQLSLPQFCFEVLEHTLPLIGNKCCQEEINFLLTLNYEALISLVFNVKSSVAVTNKDFQSKCYKIFEVLHQLLNSHREKNLILYIILLYVVIRLLNFVKPSSKYQLDEILPESLHSELATCVSNTVLVLLFPHLHSEILYHLDKSSEKKDEEVLQEYKDYLIIIESIKASVKFLKFEKKLKSTMEKLETVYNSLISLDFHQNFELIQLFVKCCLLKWRKSQLKDCELKLRGKILVKLLAHSNDLVKINVYKEIKNHAMKCLGIQEPVSPINEYSGDKMDFLFNTNILTEIICHGLNSPLNEVRKCSNEIISHLLKSKFIMSDQSWNDFVNALIPCLSLLQCHADKSATLGRCIVKMFDPDLGKSTGLPLLEILKGNIRLLFSKNKLTRDEAIPRLFWLLSKEDSSNTKLPRISVLTSLSLSDICCCVRPRDVKIRPPYYSPSRLCDVMEMLSAENVEPNLRRSALSQISVMMDDAHLHETFLEQKGVEKILSIFNNCLIEKEYKNYPDSVIPIIEILNALCFHNAVLRQELSSKIEIIYNVLRGLFLFSSDETLRQNAVELLCLLLYNECILRVPSDISNKYSISLPELVATKMCMPFQTHIHWKSSKYFEPSTRKIFMSKAKYAKLIRMCWSIHWVGSLSEILTMQPNDLQEKVYSPGIPDDMKIGFKEIENLRNCAFSFCVKQTLFNIQNATTHDAVLSSLQKLHSFFLLYNIDKSVNDEKSKNISSNITLSHLLWESTFERFMLSKPSCAQDEILLLQIIRFVQLLFRSFQSERLVDWVGKLLIEEPHPLLEMLKNIESGTYGATGRDLRLATIELTQQIVINKPNLDKNKWFLYIELASKHLNIKKNGEYHNVAYIDWFLSLLVVLTGNCNWDFNEKTEKFENIVIGLMEIIIAFHCTKDSAISFMGSNIIKNAVLVLNHILQDSILSMKGWERVWKAALLKVLGHREGANYFWLLTLWFMRDSITRTAAFQLFVGFSVSSQGCDLIDQIGIQFDHIWAHGFKVLFDENECCLVKEKCALLLSNLISQGTKASCGSFLSHLQKINFYHEISKIISNFYSEPFFSELLLNPSANMFLGQVMATPSFIKSICILLLNIISLNSVEVSEKICQSGILESLTRILAEIPDTSQYCEKYQDCLDVIQMSIAICKLLIKCMMSSWSAHLLIVQSVQFVNTIFSLVNFNLFCDKSKIITAYRNELWSEIFDLFSAILVENPECNQNNGNCGFTILNKALTDNGIDNFISSIYVSLTSDCISLRHSLFNFLINLFSRELNTSKKNTISDIFERKISVQALKLSVQNGWKGFSISETLTLNFGIRMSDILHQLFILGTNCVVNYCKTMVTNCLGTLFAVCKQTQDFCIALGLADSLAVILKQICVKLNLESIDNLKKTSGKKKIDPLLNDLESFFRLLCNFVLNNERAKTVMADCALTAVVHKLWPWCATRESLHVTTLKMLCTFTHSCDHACRTLVLSTSLSVLNLKKSPGCVTLLHAIMNQVSVEMNLISNNHDSKILSLCLQLLSNCCRVAECRSVLSKGNFLQCFNNLHPGLKKKCYTQSVKVSWLKFFVAFSCYQEGQVALTKSQEVLDILILMSSSTKPIYKITALTVLRNICFHHLNRIRMLSSSPFLSLMLDTLGSKNCEEVQCVAVAMWILSCNVQKAKVIFRSSSFETKLQNAKRYSILNEDMETAHLIEIVLEILKNR